MASSAAELGQNTNDEPGRTVCLLRRAERRRGPGEGKGAIHEPESVFVMRNSALRTLGFSI